MKTVQKNRIRDEKICSLATLFIFCVLFLCLWEKRGGWWWWKNKRRNWEKQVANLPHPQICCCCKMQKWSGWVRKRANDEKVPFCCGKFRVSLLPWGVAAEETWLCNIMKPTLLTWLSPSSKNNSLGFFLHQLFLERERERVQISPRMHSSLIKDSYSFPLSPHKRFREKKKTSSLMTLASLIKKTDRKGGKGSWQVVFHS